MERCLSSLVYRFYEKISKIRVPYEVLNCSNVKEIEAILAVAAEACTEGIVCTYIIGNKYKINDYALRITLHRLCEAELLKREDKSKPLYYINLEDFGRCSFKPKRVIMSQESANKLIEGLKNIVNASGIRYLSERDLRSVIRNICPYTPCDKVIRMLKREGIIRTIPPHALVYTVTFRGKILLEKVKELAEGVNTCLASCSE